MNFTLYNRQVGICFFTKQMLPYNRGVCLSLRFELKKIALFVITNIQALKKFT